MLTVQPATTLASRVLQLLSVRPVTLPSTDTSLLPIACAWRTTSTTAPMQAAFLANTPASPAIPHLPVSAAIVPSTGSIHLPTSSVCVLQATTKILTPNCVFSAPSAVSPVPAELYAHPATPLTTEF